MADLDFFMGDEALSLFKSSGLYTRKHPINHGQVDDWDTMERFWQQCIFNYLRCNPEEHYFLLTDSPVSTPESRECAGEIMFETFNVPGLYISVQSVLSLSAGYAFLKSISDEDSVSVSDMTGVVVDIGDGAPHVVPVVNGYVIGSSIKSFPFSGSDVTQFVLQLLQERGELIAPEDSLDIAPSDGGGVRFVDAQYQARRAVEAVTDAAGAIHQTGEQVAQAAQNAATATKGSAVQAGIRPYENLNISFD
ncbi:hypothetical protein OsI_27683 [Oryza sativa Indica Group]|uniref:Uncharacterized protein n=1 Tax=Oryza sativa subsp. indica TaxID=39946 RepID=B8BAF6_ORYSI|nr:hypothetical protein OsI_27683 [Oryza sativa Indica Group]